MKKKLLANIAVIFAAVCLFASSTSHAQSVQTTWNLTVDYRFNFVTRARETLTPINRTLSIVFPLAIRSINDYRTTTIVDFGGVSETSFSSPITPLIGADPYGNGISDPSAPSYAFSDTNDYPSEFVEEFAVKKDVYHPNFDNTRFWNYDFELRAMTRGPSRGGTGTADYELSGATLLSYLDDFRTSGRTASFGEYYQIYDQSNGTYLDGCLWGGTATLQQVTVVPEPTSAILLVFGAALCFQRRSPHTHERNAS